MARILGLPEVETGLFLDIPLEPASITSEWLTHALRDCSLLTAGEQVMDFNMEVIGEGAGFLGDVIRLKLSLSSSETKSPKSMILKIPTASRNRQLGQSLGVYEREIRFYQELQHLVNVRTPVFYFAAMGDTPDPEQVITIFRFINRMPDWLFWLLFQLLGWLDSWQKPGFVLLIEDLSDLRVGDQVAGCSADDARRALHTMARLQARFWQDESLDQFAWIVPFELTIKLMQVIYSKSLPKFLAANKDQLSDRNRQLLEWLRVNGAALLRRISDRPQTLLHGDYRLDNMFFDDNDEVVLMDWQTPMAGPAGMDLSYFLSASLATDVTVEEMDKLVEYYRCQLAENGIEVSKEQMQWDYEAGMLAVLLRVIPAENQDVIELGDARGHDLAITWVERIFVKLQRVDLDRMIIFDVT